jgi:hypothetical protein
MEDPTNGRLFDIGEEGRGLRQHLTNNDQVENGVQFIPSFSVTFGVHVNNQSRRSASNQFGPAPADGMANSR